MSPSRTAITSSVSLIRAPVPPPGRPPSVARTLVHVFAVRVSHRPLCEPSLTTLSARPATIPANHGTACSGRRTLPSSPEMLRLLEFGRGWLLGSD